jgi:hypothetical protein
MRKYQNIFFESVMFWLAVGAAIYSFTHWP